MNTLHSLGKICLKKRLAVLNNQFILTLGRGSYLLTLETEAIAASWDELCISVGFPHDSRLWDAYSSIVRHCGWIYEFSGFVAVCDRPIRISRNEQKQLHAEPGTPAIEFADGSGSYFYHGVILPENWGKLPHQQWQSQWLLEEQNAELRRILIQNIGYARLCQELAMEEIHSWAEYTLLRIANYLEPFTLKVYDGQDWDEGGERAIWRDEISSEPVHLLKMTCPSTGYIHVLRVPPDIVSAREAIRWVNHGIDPEEFSVQS